MLTAGDSRRIGTVTGEDLLPKCELLVVTLPRQSQSRTDHSRCHVNAKTRCDYPESALDYPETTLQPRAIDRFGPTKTPRLLVAGGKCPGAGNGGPRTAQNSTVRVAAGYILHNVA